MAGRKPKLTKAQLEYIVKLYTEERFNRTALSAFSGLSSNHLEHVINRLGGSKQVQMEKAMLALEKHRDEFEALASVGEKEPAYKPISLYNEAQWRWLGERYTTDNYSAQEITDFSGMAYGHIIAKLNRMGYRKKGGRRLAETMPCVPLSQRKAEFNALANK